MNTIPSLDALLAAGGARAPASTATILADELPQEAHRWYDVRRDLIRVNSASGRVIGMKMQGRPRAARDVFDHNDLCQNIQVWRYAVGNPKGGRPAHIDTAPLKHRARAWTAIQDWIRVVYEIRPEGMFVA